MQPSTFQLVQVLFVVCFVVSVESVSLVKNQTVSCDKGAISCFSCMGRDLENCVTGQTCCTGACFKLEDLKHNVVIKGCVKTKEEDASMKVRELNVPLYWAQNEKVKGESFFCSGKDYCNSSPRTLLATSVMALITFGLFQ